MSMAYRLQFLLKKEGVSPQQVVDKYHKIIGDSFKELGVSFDIYHRTSSKMHHETASEFFTELHSQGLFVEKVSAQYFDEKDQEFLADRYITGTCPHCKSDGAYGDQCEQCGTSLNVTDLIEPKSALSGNKPIMKETKHWFLPLDKYENWLKEWILDGHKSDWKSNVYGQCKSWLDQGLQPRAVTRDLNWVYPFLQLALRVKYFTFGLTLLLVTFLLPNNGQKIMEKIGVLIGNLKTPRWFNLLVKTTSFFIVLYFQRC